MSWDHKLDTLWRMTVANGCTPAEARSARERIATLQQNARDEIEANYASGCNYTLTEADIVLRGIRTQARQRPIPKSCWERLRDRLYSRGKR